MGFSAGRPGLEKNPLFGLQLNQPTPAKIPDYASFQDATQKATSKGSANTFLTGSSGIDPGLLRIGKQTLLGG